MRIGEFETHPIADAFPLLQGDDFEAFKDSIERTGLVLKKGTLHEGRILDGRNRYRAALELGLKMTFQEYEGDDPMGFVLACNRWRQHSNESQRAMTACRLATLKRGRPRKNRPKDDISNAEAAKAMNVGERTVERAQAVMKSAAPEVIEAVDRGDMDLTRAAELAKLPHDEQLEQLQGRASAKPEPKTETMSADAAAKQLMRTVTKALEQLGASIRGIAEGELELAYAGRVWSLRIDSESP